MPVTSENSLLTYPHFSQANTCIGTIVSCPFGETNADKFLSKSVCLNVVDKEINFMSLIIRLKRIL